MIYLWVKGRRRAEDEADSARRSIRDAQDRYDAKPRPLMALLLNLFLAAQALGLVPRVIALVEDQLWLKAGVAGLIAGIGLGALTISFAVLAYRQLRRWRSSSAA